MKFFNPTKKLKELLLLKHIKENPSTTQKEIAQVIGGAPSTVNEYIENLEKRRLLKRDYKSVKTVNYNITPQGIKEKNYLAITYFHELLKLYKLAEENIENFLIELETKGYQKILIYGAGEVAETILNIFKNTQKNLKVLALIDDDQEKQKTSLLGYQIISRKQIKDYQHDAVVITSYTYEDDIRKKLEEITYPAEKIERFFAK